MKGSNAKQSKALNLRLVLSQIVTLGPLSRADIARNTQLTKQTITNIVEALLDIDLISQTGIKKVKGAGKPSVMLCLNANAAHTLAIRIIGNELELGIFKLNGECIKEYRNTINSITLTQYVSDSANQLLKDAGIDKSSVLGAGLVVQGTQTSPFEMHNFAQKIQIELAEIMSLPVALSDCASACASYQLLFGEAKQLDSFVYMHIGHIIEAAAVYERKALVGHNGLIGALGDLFVTPNAIKHTNQLGRLNDFASLCALKQILKQPNISAAELIEQQHSNNRKVLSWLAQAQEPLSLAIHTIESLLNPQTIIIGGDTSDWLLDVLLTKLRPLIPSISQYGDRQVIRLIRTPDVANIALKGCATLPLQAALDPNHTQTLRLSGSTELTELQALIYGTIN